MAAPIYVFSASRHTEAYYEHSEECEADWAKVKANREELGAKGIMVCDIGWSSEWDGLLVDEWPSVEALQEHTRFCNELNWMRYYEPGVVILGTKLESS